MHDIHLYTDSSPDYVSIEDFVTTATSVWDDPEDEAVAFWRWMVRSQLQTSTTREDGAPIWDPIRFYDSYPNSNCGYKASYFNAFVETKGGDWAPSPPVPTSIQPPVAPCPNIGALRAYTWLWASGLVAGPSDASHWCIEVRLVETQSPGQNPIGTSP